MGTWGVKPFENDSAGDLLDVILQKLEKIFSSAIRKDWQRSDSGEVRAAIVLFTAICNVSEYRIDDNQKQEILAYLKNISEDPDYLSEWENSKGVRVQLLKEIAEVKKLKVF